MREAYMIQFPKLMDYRLELQLGNVVEFESQSVHFYVILLFIY